MTGDAATKAKAAAVKAVGSGTAGAVTTDFPGTGYEVTVTKSDGSMVEVHLDSSFNVIQGHHGRHGFGGPAHGTAVHEDAEKPVTGGAATKAKAAAITAAGGTAGAVTTDFDGGGYEVTVTRTDCSTVQVHLDSSFGVVQGHHGVIVRIPLEGCDPAPTGPARAKRPTEPTATGCRHLAAPRSHPGVRAPR